MTKPLALDPNLSQAERIDRVCTAFEAAWKAGEDQRPEDWLSDVSGADRLALVKELVLLEVHYRRRRGEAVDRGAYQQRFPELQESWLQEAVPSGQETAADYDTPAPDRPVAAPDALPETVRFSGDYELGEELGRGGMGVVYRGHDAGLGRTLAVKVLLEKHADNEDLKRRFLEEAQIMGQLQHPGVAPIHDIGRLADGRPFFSMKQINGQTLADLLKREGAGIRGQEPEPDAPARELASANHEQRLQNLPRFLGIFEQVCQTLAFAHSRKILHRDLKPANVMVGAFGEVQVMDWGLAKRISDGGLQSADLSDPSTESQCADLQAGISNLQCTEAGRVLGTPAYMAPEQARGEIEKLDERCDVFGLGAILCEVLTGRPPFPGDTQLDSHRMAMKSDLRDTFARLEGCGADPELVGLAQRCLAAEKEGRPRQAGEVAEALVCYQTKVRERLQRAEVESARAKVRVIEERRRRRVWLALAATVVVFALAGAGAGLWYYQYRAERAQEEGRQAQQREDLERNLRDEFVEADKQRQSLREQLKKPLQAAKLLSDIDGWKAQVDKARQSWNRAKLVADNGKDLLEASWLSRLETLNQQLTADDNDWHWAKKLDDVRLKAAAPVDGKWSPGIVAKDYPPLFREMGLDVEQGDEARVAERIAKSPLRFALVAALDNWVDNFPGEGKKLVQRLLEIARRADPDPWRAQVRDVQLLNDRTRALRLVRDVRLEEQTPQIILLLATMLRNAVGQQEAGVLLQRAVFHYPKDFWLHHRLSGIDPESVAGCRTVLALRPNSAPAHMNIGFALYKKKDLDGAIQHARKAIQLDPQFVMAYDNLALALHGKKDLDGAVEQYHKALQLDAQYVPALFGLGLVLADKADLDGAIRCYRKAIAADPQYVRAYINLGSALTEKKDFVGAVFHLRKALDLDPNYAEAHNNLGVVLMAQKDLDMAIKHFHKAIAIDPNHVHAYNNLGIALDEKKDLDGAIEQYHKALKLDPKYAFAHYNLANALRDKKRGDEAIKHYLKAIEINANYARAHNNLGLALIVKKDPEGAMKHFRKAIAIDPNLTPPRLSLGSMLIDRNDIDGAARQFQKVIELDPKNADAHYKLGNVLRAKGDPEGAILHYAKAIEHYAKAIELDPQSGLPHYHLGHILHARKDPDGAIKHFRIAIDLDPTFPDAHHELGRTLEDKKDVDGAAKHFQKAIELDPNHIQGHTSLGKMLQKNNLKSAIWHYNKALAIDPNYVPAHVNLGDALRAKRDLKGAIDHLRTAIEIDPNHADAHYGLGIALSDKKDLVEAIRHYRKAIQIDPNHVDARYNLGCALTDKKDLDGAIEQFEKALALDPNRAMVHNNLGIVLYKKKLHGAIEHLRKAIELDPKLTQPYFNLGDALFTNNDPDGAIAQYEKGLALDPKNARGYYNMGRVLSGKEDMDGASKYFHKAVEIDPNYAKAHNDLGMTLALGSKKDLDRASKHLHKAIELDPTDAEVYCNLGFVLREQGKFAEALKVLHKGHALGTKAPGWRFPSAQWIKKCERLLELDRKLPAILKGDAQPRDAAEQAELANLCLQYKKCYVAAAHFLAAALKAEPKLARQHRYNAACAAVLAAAGKSKDADKLDKDEPAKLRRQALDWLRAELAGHKAQLQAKPETARQVHSSLQHWRKDTDLAGVREEKQLAKLPDAERKQWRQFWEHVERSLMESGSNRG